jgi:hypothetical protein
MFSIEMIQGHDPWNKVSGNIIYLLQGNHRLFQSSWMKKPRDFIKAFTLLLIRTKNCCTELLFHPFKRSYWPLTLCWYQVEMEAAALARENESLIVTQR